MACRLCRTPFAKTWCSSGLIILALVACSALFGPFGPKGPPDPTVVQTVPRPDFFFLWLYAALALLPPQMETFLLLVGPVVAIGCLIALPLISGDRREALAPEALCNTVAPAHYRLTGGAHSACHLRSVVARHGGLEQHAGAAQVAQWPFGPRTHRRGRIASQAMPQLPRPWRRRRPARSRAR